MERYTTKELVDMQREFFRTGVTRPVDYRYGALGLLKKAIQDNEKRIAEALHSDLHKHPMESYMCETGLVLDEIEYHMKHLAGWAKNRRVRTPLAQFRSKSFVSPEPYGVVLIMAPWNYPLQLCLEPLIGAISAGNCAVIKPSAYAPATSHLLAEIIGECFEPEYIAVKEGGRAENTDLLAQRFDYIFFTGSVAVGKVVMEAASKNLTPVSLELGGKSPVIVDQTADLKVAARRIAFGKCINSGQTCVEPDYLLIQENVRDRFIECYKEALAEFFPEGAEGKSSHTVSRNPSRSSQMLSEKHSQMCRIISEKHYLKKKALLEGQSAAVGGGFDDETRLIEPTLLLDVDPASPVMQEEIFAPILPVITFKEIGEAIDFVSSREKPLAFYLFTTDAETERRVLSSCSFGGGCINDTIIHLATPYMGFGGVGNSGMGQYHGKLSFDTFTHYRSIVKKAYTPDLAMRYMPYTDSKLGLIKKFLK